jgi:large subunit ribosomal protein L9
MELILKQDVDNLGFQDEIVVVKPGYGRNFLIPKGMAVLATPSAKKVLAENLKQRAVKEAKIKNEATKVAEGINALELKLTAKAGDKGKLFGSITNIQVAEAISKAGFAVEKKNIKIMGSVKTTGKYDALIRLHREVDTKITFEVVSE